MSLIHDIVTQLHLESWIEELAVCDCGCGIPNLDNVKLTLGR